MGRRRRLESTFRPFLVPFDALTRHSYWTMHFDASPRTLRSLNGIMRRDPRVIRWNVLKLGDEVEDLAKQGQRILAEARKESQLDQID